MNKLDNYNTLAGNYPRTQTFGSGKTTDKATGFLPGRGCSAHPEPAEAWRQWQQGLAAVSEYLAECGSQPNEFPCINDFPHYFLVTYTTPYIRLLTCRLPGWVGDSAVAAGIESAAIGFVSAGVVTLLLLARALRCCDTLYWH